MKTGPRETIVWLENKLMLEKKTIALTHLFIEPKGVNLQRASTSSQMWVTNFACFQQLEILTSHLSASVGTLTNHTCPTWKNRFAGHCISLPDPNSLQHLVRHHHHYHHLVCSDLTGTLCETGLRSGKELKSAKHRKFCWLRPAESLFWKPEPWKETCFPVRC